MRILKEEYCSKIDFFILFLIFYFQVAIDMINNLFPSVFKDLLSDETYGKTSIASLLISDNSGLPAIILFNIFVLYSFYGSRGIIKKESLTNETTTQSYLRILVKIFSELCLTILVEPLSSRNSQIAYFSQIP
jgi:hypothetical protein